MFCLFWNTFKKEACASIDREEVSLIWCRVQDTEDVRCLEFGGSIFQVRRFFLMEGFLKKSGLALRGFGSSDSVVLKEFSVLQVWFLFQFSQWIISQVLQFFQFTSRILNSPCLLFFNSHKKQFSSSSVQFFGSVFRLSMIVGFYGRCQRTLQTNILPFLSILLSRIFKQGQSKRRGAPCGPGVRGRTGGWCHPGITNTELTFYQKTVNKPIFGQLSNIISRVALFVLTNNTARAVVWVKIFIKWS